MLNILEGLLKSYGTIPTPPEMASFEKRYNDGVKGNVLKLKSQNELSTTFLEETYFQYYDYQEKQNVTFPCVLEYCVDKYSGFPNNVTVTSSFGKTEIGGFVENERGIPYPTKISFRAHDYLSTLIDYRHPLSVRARIEMPKEEPSEYFQGDPIAQEPYTEEYDPEKSLANQEEYNPEDTFLDESNVDKYDDSNVTYADPDPVDKANCEKGSDRPSFNKMFRYYMTSEVNKIPTLREHREISGKISSGPEVDNIRSTESPYYGLKDEEMKGMWLAVTPDSSEADPRADFEKWMLDFHSKCFFQCFSRSIDAIRDMNDELKHFREN